MRRVIPDRHAGSEFPGFPEQSGDYFLRVAHTMRRVIPDRRTWSELLRLPRTARRVSRTVQTNAASSPLTATQETSFLLLSRTVRRVSTTATQGASHPSCFPDRKAVRRVVLRPPSNAASFSGFPELSKPMRRVIPPGLPHPVRRVPSCTPEQWARIFCFPEFCGELCSEQKQLTALTIGNEGIQIQWPSRAHTRKHEAALPPVLMFFL